MAYYAQPIMCFFDQEGKMTGVSGYGSALISIDEANEIISYMKRYISHYKTQDRIDFENYKYEKEFEEKQIRDRENEKLTPKEKRVLIQDVYLVRDTFSGNYKIGTTKNTKARISSLRTSNPNIELVVSFKCDSDHEKILHEKYIDKKISGEWFALDEFDVISVINHLKSVSNHA